MSPTDYIDKGATLSADGVYRYALWRRWREGDRGLALIGLNPSIADGQQDDPTIRRCVAFAKREGRDYLVMLNLFALRATDPRVMLKHPAPIGPENDSTIYGFAWSDKVVLAVAAWGAHGNHLGRAKTVQQMLPALRCFGLTAGGCPRHPLYLPAAAPLVSLGSP